MKRIAGVVAALVLLGATPGIVSPDPYEIYARARQYWQHQHYPASIGYTVAVEVTEAGNDRVEHYASYYDADDDIVHVDAVSDYQHDHPPSGRGVNFGINILGGFVHVGRPEFPVDFLGVPELAPNYSFGIAPYVPASKMTPEELVTEIRQEFHDPKPSARPGSQGGIPEIAEVTAYKRLYRIVLLGIDDVGGQPAYHLGLTPLQDPRKYRLRQLWIDTTSFATRKLITDGNFQNGPGPGASWTVTFADIGGAHYIAQESTGEPLDYQGLRYTNAVVRFENVRAQEPPFYNGIYQPQNPDDLLNEPPS